MADKYDQFLDSASDNDVIAANPDVDVYDKFLDSGNIGFPTPGQALSMPDPGQQIPIQFIPRRETAERMGRTAIEAGMATGGSVLGAISPMPGGTQIGGMLGYAAGREINDIVFGEDVGSLGEELAEAGDNVLEGAKMEAYGLIGGQVLTAPISAIKGIVKGTGILTEVGNKMMKQLAKPKFSQEHITRLKAAKELGVPVSMGEANLRPFVRRTENFFRKLVLPSGRIAKFDQARVNGLINKFSKIQSELLSGKLTPEKEAAFESTARRIQFEIDKLLAGKVQARGKVLNKIRNEVLDKFGANVDYETLGKTAKEIIESRREEFRTLSTEMFDKAKDILPLKGAEKVETVNIVGAIDKAISRERTGLKAATNDTINLLESFKNDFITKFPESQPSGILDQFGNLVPASPTPPPKLEDTFSGILRKRSDINDFLSKKISSVGLSGQEQIITSSKKVSSLLSSIKESLDKDLVRFSEKTGTNVAGIVQSAIDMSRRGFEFGDIPAVRKIIKAQPDEVADILIKAGKSATTQLFSELKAEQRIPLKKSVINRILSEDDGITMLRSISSVGEDNLRNLLGDQGAEDLIDFSRKILSLERGIARINVSGTAAKELSLGPVDLAGNRFWKQFLTNRSPSRLVNILFGDQEQVSNVRRAYSALRSVGQDKKINDIKYQLLERIMPSDKPISTSLVEANARKVGDKLLRVGLESEYGGFKDFLEVVKLVNVEQLSELPREKAGFEVIRMLGEPIGLAASPVLFRRNIKRELFFTEHGRRILKRFAKISKMADTAAIRKETNEMLSKLIAIGMSDNERD